MLTVEVLASLENCLAIGPGHELSSTDSREFSRLSWKSRSACTAVVTLLDRVNLRKLGRREKKMFSSRIYLGAKLPSAFLGEGDSGGGRGSKFQSMCV